MPQVKIKPRLDKLFKDGIQGLVVSLAKKNKTLVISTSTVDCPNCFYDRLNKSSSGKYNNTGPKPFTGKTCPVCRGKGRVTTNTNKKLKARVKFGEIPTGGNMPLAPGELLEGQIEVKVRIQDYQKLVDGKHFTVDGVRYEKQGKVRRRGLLSNAVAIMLAVRDD